MTERLYEMTGRYLAVAQLLDDPDIPQEALLDTIEGIEGEIEIKAENLLKVIANMDADVSALDAEIRRLQARKKVFQNRQAGLRDYLRHNMEVTGITKIECSLFLISLAKGRPLVVIDDEERLPDHLVDVEIRRKPNRAAILRELKAGKEVEGASLGTSAPSLRIK